MVVMPSIPISGLASIFIEGRIFSTRFSVPFPGHTRTPATGSPFQPPSPGSDRDDILINDYVAREFNAAGNARPGKAVSFPAEKEQTLLHHQFLFPVTKACNTLPFTKGSPFFAVSAISATTAWPTNRSVCPGL